MAEASVSQDDCRRSLSWAVSGLDLSRAAVLTSLIHCDAGYLLVSVCLDLLNYMTFITEMWWLPLACMDIKKGLYENIFISVPQIQVNCTGLKSSLTNTIFCVMSNQNKFNICHKCCNCELFIAHRQNIEFKSNTHTEKDFLSRCS